MKSLRALAARHSGGPSSTRTVLVISVFLGLFAIGAAGALVACSDAVLNSPPEAEAGAPVCSTAAEVRCDASAPSAMTCTGNANATGIAAQLPTTTSYAAGCQAFFRTQDCSSLASCQCETTGAADAGQAEWACSQ